jgi:hypothetical protein
MDCFASLAMTAGYKTLAPGGSRALLHAIALLGDGVRATVTFC